MHAISPQAKCKVFTNVPTSSNGAFGVFSTSKSMAAVKTILLRSSVRPNLKKRKFKFQNGPLRRREDFERNSLSYIQIGGRHRRRGARLRKGKHACSKMMEYRVDIQHLEADSARNRVSLCERCSFRPNHMKSETFSAFSSTSHGGAQCARGAEAD